MRKLFKNLLPKLESYIEKGIIQIFPAKEALPKVSYIKVPVKNICKISKPNYLSRNNMKI